MSGRDRALTGPAAGGAGPAANSTAINSRQFYASRDRRAVYYEF